MHFGKFFYNKGYRALSPKKPLWSIKADKNPPPLFRDQAFGGPLFGAEGGLKTPGRGKNGAVEEKKNPPLKKKVIFYNPEKGGLKKENFVKTPSPRRGTASNQKRGVHPGKPLGILKTGGWN